MDMIDEFRDTAARLFTDFATAETLEAAERGTLPLDLWNAVNESGFGLVLVPEAHGGIGAGLREAAAILNAAGEHAVPGPLLELMLGNQMLALAGRDVSAAPLSIAFAADEGAKTLRNVPWVRGAEQVLVVAPRGLAIVPAGRLEARPEIADASGEPRARFELPAGTVQLAAGVSYRKEYTRSEIDPLLLIDPATGNCTLGSQCSSPLRGGYNVKEGYAEAFSAPCVSLVCAASTSAASVPRYNSITFGSFASSRPAPSYALRP